MTIPPGTPLLIDLDGTLVDSLEDIRASLNHARALAGLEPAASDQVRDWIGDGAALLLDRGLRPALDRADSPWTPDAIRAAFVVHHREQCTATVTPYPGVAAALDRWREDGHPLAVVTNKPEELARRVLAHVGLAEHFDAVVGGDSASDRKPSPAPLAWALEQLAAAGKDIDPRPWMIGDGIPDVRAGRAFGAFTVAVTYGYRSPAELAREGPDAWWPQFGGPTLDSPPDSLDPPQP